MVGLAHMGRAGRLFRLLAAFYVVEETGEDQFKPTPFSSAIGDESTKVRASLEAAYVSHLLRPVFFCVPN